MILLAIVFILIIIGIIYLVFVGAKSGVASKEALTALGKIWG